MKDKLKLIIEICKLYYYENLSQEKIARKLYISRSQVSRLLNYARKNNIVSITVKDPFKKFNDLEEKIVKKFNIKCCVVVDSSKEEVSKLISSELSLLLSKLVKVGSKIGVGAGTTIEKVSRNTSIYRGVDLTFVSLLGGVINQGNKWNANNNCDNFSSLNNGKSIIINAPLVVRSSILKDELLKDVSIKPIIELYENLDISIVGVGEITKESTLGKTDMTKKEISDANEMGAKAIVCSSFLNEDGKEILLDKTEMFIGAKLKHLAKCPNVITISYGKNKVSSIKAVLKSGVTDYLITDNKTAIKLLEGDE